MNTISWGKKILILYLGFVAMIVFMVYKTMNQKIDLVADDYYEQELKYEDKITGQRNTNTLTEQPQCVINNNNIIITFPKELNTANVKGSLSFFCPSDNKKDKTMSLQLDNSNQQIISHSTIAAGLYKVKLEWQTEGKNYYYETPLVISK